MPAGLHFAGLRLLPPHNSKFGQAVVVKLYAAPEHLVQVDDH